MSKTKKTETTMTTIFKAARRAIRRWTEGVGLLALSVVPIAGQAVPINETRTLRPDASVELSVVSHSLVVEGWDRNEIQIVGEYDSRFERLDVESSAQAFRFEIEPVRRGRTGPRDRRQGSA